MKNLIPLITAVLLGLAAVFAVSKTMKPEEKKAAEEPVEVLALSRNLKDGDTLDTNNTKVKYVSPNDVPQRAVPATDSQFVIGQKLKHAVKENEYLLYSDLELDYSYSGNLNTNEWGVPVTFADRTILTMIHPGDKIAIAATFKYEKETRGIGGDESNVSTEVVEVTMVPDWLLNVEVREIRGSTVLLGLKPEEALKLTVLQKKAKLYPLMKSKKSNAGDQCPPMVQGDYLNTLAREQENVK